MSQKEKLEMIPREVAMEHKRIKIVQKNFTFVQGARYLNSQGYRFHAGAIAASY